MFLFMNSTKKPFRGIGERCEKFPNTKIFILQEPGTKKGECKGIIHLVRSQNFSKNKRFLPPGGKKC